MTRCHIAVPHHGEHAIVNARRTPTDSVTDGQAIRGCRGRTRDSGLYAHTHLMAHGVCRDAFPMVNSPREERMTMTTTPYFSPVTTRQAWPQVCPRRRS